MGDIALYSGLAGGAESIIVPEVDFNMDEVCKRVIQGKNRGGKLHHIIALAEGVGNAYEVAEEIEKKLVLKLELQYLVIFKEEVHQLPLIGLWLVKWDTRP